MNKHLLARASVLLLGLTPAFAADAPPRCTSLFDDAQRLACYDAQFGKPVRPAPTQGTTSASRAAPAPQAVLPAQAAAATVVPTPVPKPEAAAASKPERGTLTSRVTEVTRVSNDRFVVTLENGQTWTQLERDPTAEVQVGDTVKIRSALLGSYMLETRGGVRTRVRSSR